MDTDAIPISMEELAEAAGRYFRHAEVRDIPSKLWLDAYVHASQVYLRACFDDRLIEASQVRLEALAAALGDAHGLSIVAVAYPQDHEWSEIEQRARELNAVL